MPARPIDVFEYELQGEKAASLGRVAAKMEAACARLRARREALAIYDVPPELIARMGPRRR